MRRRVAERQAEVLTALAAEHRDYATNIALTPAKSNGKPAPEEELSRA